MGYIIEQKKKDKWVKALPVAFGDIDEAEDQACRLYDETGEPTRVVDEEYRK